MIYAVLGFILGGALVYFWRVSVEAKRAGDVAALRAQLEQAASVADARVAAAAEHHADSVRQQAEAHARELDAEQAHADQMLAQLREQYELRIKELELDKEKLTKEFAAAARDSLQQTQRDFTAIALKDLQNVRTEQTGDIDKQKQEITNAVGEMKSRIEEVQKLVKEFEAERGAIYGSLNQQLSQLHTAGQSWHNEAASLRTVLSKGTATIGTWGELVLRNIFNACNLREGIDYEEQVHVLNDEQSRLKPDFVVKLPQGGHKQVIDSKAASLEPLLLAEQTTDPAQRADLAQQFARGVKSRVDELAGKEYQKSVDPDVPYVVMFIPSEAAIRVAFDADPELFGYALTHKIVIASPATIMPLLLLIARAWQQNEFAANAQQLGREVEVLGSRLATWVGHLSKMESAISNVVKHWNAAAGSWQRSVTPQLDRARVLGASLPAELADQFTAVAEEPRELRLPESGTTNVEQG